VPQVGQKPRRRSGEDRYQAGSAAVQAKPAAAKFTQAGNGAPTASWHIRQWQ
jgi:hypothetical protein